MLTPYEMINLQQRIEVHLERIERIFKPGVKITLIVRTPSNNEADVLLSMDDLDEVKNAIDRSKLRPSS